MKTPSFVIRFIPTVKILLTLTIFLMVGTYLQAQSGRKRLKQGNIAVGLTAGYSASYMYGSGRNGLKTYGVAFNEQTISEAVYRNEIEIKHGPRLGMYFEYAVSDRLALRSGLLHQQRGYSMRIDGIERDLEYQLDYKFQYTERFRISTLDLPLYMVWGSKKGCFFTTGIYLQIGLPSTAKTLHEHTQEVLINGELDEELSTPPILREIDVRNSTSSSIGFHFGAHKMLSKRLAISLEIQIGKPYAVFALGDIADLSAGLTISHPISTFN